MVPQHLSDLSFDSKIHQGLSGYDHWSHFLATEKTDSKRCTISLPTQNIPGLLYRTGDSAQSHLTAWMGGSLGEMDAHVCMSETLLCAPESITTLLTS